VSTEYQHQSPGPLLALFMRRHGWSAARLAEIAGGVSASSVRAYTADRSTPRPSQALAVANALGSQDGRKMLEAWGYADLAEGFTEEWQRATVGYEGRALAAAETSLRQPNLIDYSGEPLSDPGLGLVRAVLVWVQSVEASARDRKAP
jgi:hypothetical protein